MCRETIADLNQDVQEYQQQIYLMKDTAGNEKELELNKFREEVAQTKHSLFLAEAECLTTQRKLESAKDKVDRVKRHEHEKQKKFAAKAKEAMENAQGETFQG